MDETTGNNGKKVFRFIFGFEIMLALLLVLALFIPQKKYSLTDKDNRIALPFGRYFVDIDYSISADTDKANYLYILNDDGDSDGVLETHEFLHHEKSKWRAEFWIVKPKMNVNFFVVKQDTAGQSQYLNYANYEVESTPYLVYLGILLMLFIIACTVVVYFIVTGRIVLTTQKIAYICILAAVLLISCIPLFEDTLIKGDDLITHAIRLEGLAAGYLAGQFPVKVEPLLNGGYGYAFSTYYSSLFYNIPAILRLMGFTIQGAYKAYIVLINFATICVAYYSFKKIFKKPELALVSTIMYSLSTLRIVDLYQRSAVGEFTALVFLPLIAAGLWRIYTTPTDDKNYHRLWIMPVIGYFGVIESHVLSTEIFGAFTVLVCLFMFKKTFKKETFLVLLKVVLVSVILNIGYLLPFIESYLCESTYISSGTSNSAMLTFCLTFVDLFKFVDKFVEFSVWRNYMVPGLGPTVIPVLILLIYTIIRKGIKKHRKLIIICGILTIITSVLTLDIVPYEKVLTYLGNNPTSVGFINSIARIISNMVKNIQFAMRFITVGTCTYIIFVIGLVSQYDEDGNAHKISLIRLFEIFLAVITIIQFVWACRLTTIEMKHINFYTMSENDKELSSTIGNYEYLPLRAYGGFPQEVFREEGTFNAANAEVTDYVKKYTNVFLHASVKNEDGGSIELPLLYYRGYKAVNTDNGSKVKLVKSENAQLMLELDGNFDGNIKVYYAGKISWHIAELISVITFSLLMVYVVKIKIENKE